MDDEKCKFCREDLDHRIEGVIKTMDEHSGDIKELTKISIKLSTLYEGQAKMLEEVQKRNDMLEKVLAQKMIPEEQPKKNNLQIFLDSKLGIFVLSMLAICCLIIVIAAVGQEAAKTAAPIIKGKIGG